MPGGLRQASTNPAAGLAPVSGVFPAGVKLRLPEIRLQAISFRHVMQIPQRITPYA